VAEVKPAPHVTGHPAGQARRNPATKETPCPHRAPPPARRGPPHRPPPAGQPGSATPASWWEPGY
jgi:hypothetical protein